MGFRRFFLFFAGAEIGNYGTPWRLVFLFRIYELETSRLEGRNFEFRVCLQRREGPQVGEMLNPSCRGRKIARVYMQTYDPRVPD